METKGWTTEHWERTRGFRRQAFRTNKIKVNQHRVTSFMFFNFSINCSEEELWVTFRRWRRAIDIYMALKTFKDRRRFGFIIYQHVDNKDWLMRRLNLIKVGGMQLTVV